MLTEFELLAELNKAGQWNLSKMYWNNRIYPQKASIHVCPVWFFSSARNAQVKSEIVGIIEIFLFFCTQNPFFNLSLPWAHFLLWLTDQCFQFHSFHQRNIILFTRNLQHVNFHLFRFFFFWSLFASMLTYFTSFSCIRIWQTLFRQPPTFESLHTAWCWPGAGTSNIK